MVGDFRQSCPHPHIKKFGSPSWYCPTIFRSSGELSTFEITDQKWRTRRDSHSLIIYSCVTGRRLDSFALVSINHDLHYPGHPIGSFDTMAMTIFIEKLTTNIFLNIDHERERDTVFFFYIEVCFIAGCISNYGQDDQI